MSAKKIFSNIEDVLEFTSRFSEDLNQLIIIDENGKKSVVEVLNVFLFLKPTKFKKLVSKGALISKLLVFCELINLYSQRMKNFFKVI